MSDYFPTEFAQKIGKEFRIYPRKEMERFVYDLDSENKRKKDKAKALYDMHERMESFQNLAIAGSFKEALVAYDGFELGKPQKKALKKIHKSTTIWAKGKLIDKILSKLCESSSGKEVKELSEILVKVLGMDMEGAGAGGTQGLEAYVITRNAKV